MHKGKFKAGMKHGHGVELYPTGENYEGYWDKDKKVRKGILTCASLATSHPVRRGPDSLLLPLTLSVFGDSRRGFIDTDGFKQIMIVTADGKLVPQAQKGQLR